MIRKTCAGAHVLPPAPIHLPALFQLLALFKLPALIQLPALVAAGLLLAHGAHAADGYAGIQGGVHFWPAYSNRDQVEADTDARLLVDGRRSAPSFREAEVLPGRIVATNACHASERLRRPDGDRSRAALQ